MAQVTYTVNQVINNSLYLLGELATNETPDAFMLATGIELLNELINKFSADSIYIPYLSPLDFNMVQGQPTYTIGNDIGNDIIADRVVDLSFANYTVTSSGQSIIYPLQIITKSEYYNVIRLSPLNTRPGFIFLNKQDTYSEVTLYPAPDQPYPCSLKVKKMIDSLSEHELLTELPPFYYGFLKYALAQKFLSYYPSGNWNAQAQAEYDDYYNVLKNANETDLTIRPTAILTRPSPFWWQNILAY